MALSIVAVIKTPKKEEEIHSGIEKGEIGKNGGESRDGPYANQDMPHTHHFVSLTALYGMFPKLVKTCSFSYFFAFSSIFLQNYKWEIEETKNWQRILPFVLWQAALAALAIVELIFAYFR